MPRSKEALGDTLKEGPIRNRVALSWLEKERTFVQVLRVDDGYSVEINAYYPDYEGDPENDRKGRQAAHRAALDLFRKLARRGAVPEARVE